MSNAMTSGHSDAEQLAAFVDGHLDHEELQAVTAHLAECEECRAMIREAVAFEREVEVEARHTRRRMWWAVAAGVAVVVAALPFGLRYSHQREIRADVHAVYAVQKERVFAGRYSGEEFHGEYRPQRGTGGEDNDDLDSDLRRAATAKLSEDAADDESPAAVRARALAEATDRDFKGAWQTISKIRPDVRDAATWNDVAVIALANNKTDDALDAVRQALQLKPDMPEALFTQWAILQSRQAANAYFSVDSSSQWAAEIRRKMELQ